MPKRKSMLVTVNQLEDTRMELILGMYADAKAEKPKILRLLFSKQEWEVLVAEIFFFVNSPTNLT